jgi:hypothetical protein
MFVEPIHQTQLPSIHLAYQHVTDNLGQLMKEFSMSLHNQKRLMSVAFDGIGSLSFKKSSKINTI